MGPSDRDPESPLCINFFSSDALTVATRHKFVSHLWPTATSLPSIDDFPLQYFQAYFGLVELERSQTSAEDHAIHTYEDITSTVDVLRSSSSCSFTAIVHLVEKRLARGSEFSIIALSVELTVRLWLLLNIRNRITADKFLLHTSIPWVDDDSLESVISTYIIKQPCDTGDQFEHHMNVSDMQRIGGFQFEWTPYLTLHLTINNSTVRIFHLCSVLNRMKESAK